MNGVCNIIIDEIGLVGAKILEVIENELPRAKVYCLGDPLQLRGVNDNPTEG